MKKRRGRCRSYHRTEKPAAERELSALGHCRKGKHHKNNHDPGNRRLINGQKLGQIRDMKLQGGIENCYSKAAAAEKVHPECLERILNGLRLLVVPDQKEGAHRCNLPEEIHPDKVIG